MPTNSKQTCMAQQFHNGLLLDYEGMMRGELGELWDGKLIVRAEDDTVIALFEDESWYARTQDSVEGHYIIAKDDETLVETLESLYRYNSSLAEKFLNLLEAWGLEALQREAAELTNSMSRRLQ